MDYAQVVKVYGHDAGHDHRYSTTEVIGTEKYIVKGTPDMKLVSTSYVERLNATTRLHMKRLTPPHSRFSARSWRTSRRQ